MTDDKCNICVIRGQGVESTNHLQLKYLAVLWLKEKYPLPSEEIFMERSCSGYTSYEKKMVLSQPHHIKCILSPKKHITIPYFVEIYSPLWWEINKYINEHVRNIPKKFLDLWFTKNKVNQEYELEHSRLGAFCLKYILIKSHNEDYETEEKIKKKSYCKEIIKLKEHLTLELFRKLLIELSPSIVHDAFIRDIPMVQSVGITPISQQNKHYRKRMIADVLDETHKIVIECGIKNIQKLSAWSALGYTAYWLNFKKELFVYEDKKLTKIQNLLEKSRNPSPNGRNGCS